MPQGAGMKHGKLLCPKCGRENLQFGEPCYTCSIKASVAAPCIVLTNSDLQVLYDSALEQWRSGVNRAIDGQLWPLACYLEQFQALCARRSIKITIELPTRSHVEPIEDY